jgi:LmbE family N-acetylglucosaminyl deacetylase
MPAKLWRTPYIDGKARIMPISRRADVAALNAPFVEGLTDPQHGPIEAHNVAVAIAHPDDETVGCGALLSRLEGASIILVTDGAPRNLVDAQTYGFAGAADYAAARLTEMRAALAIAGFAPDALLPLDFADQEAALNLVSLVMRLTDICTARGIRVLLTHAYEGGHPDHDAAAFAVHCVARMLAASQPILVIEMPFYRLGENGPVYQRFQPDREKIQITIPLDEEERARKARMIAAYATQRRVLEPFPTDLERFRPAPAYDFSALPNDGRLLYERYDWGMDGTRWCALARSALGDLNLGASA